MSVIVLFHLRISISCISHREKEIERERWTNGRTDGQADREREREREEGEEERKRTSGKLITYALVIGSENDSMLLIGQKEKRRYERERERRPREDDREGRIASW